MFELAGPARQAQYWLPDGYSWGSVSFSFFFPLLSGETDVLYVVFMHLNNLVIVVSAVYRWYSHKVTRRCVPMPTLPQAK